MARPKSPQGVELLGHELLHEGFLRLERYRLRHRRFDGGWSPELSREVLVRGHAVAVLPYDPQADRVVLIEQFRVGALRAQGDPWLLELVAGIREEGESVEEVARREGREEAGCRFHALVPIHDYLVSPGGDSERITLFCGRVESEGLGGLHGVAEEGEDIRVHLFDFAEAMEMVDNGRVNSATPLIALHWLARHRDRLRQIWR